MSEVIALESLQRRVLKAIATVPAGRVTTYGAIAEAVDAGPRQVAWILANEPESAKAPWHRVVASTGRLTIPDFERMAEQVERLRREGVSVENRRILNFRAIFYAP